MTTTYITIEDLELNYTQKDFPQKPDGSVDINLINSAIERASTLIDSKLKTAGVKFPISASSIIKLKTTAMSITRYYYSQRNGEMTEWIQKEYKDQLDFLDQIIVGNFKLDDEATQAGFYNIYFEIN